jgi:hypothetical protein
VIPELQLLRVRAKLEGLDVAECYWGHTDTFALFVPAHSGNVCQGKTIEEAYRRLLGDIS